MATDSEAGGLVESSSTGTDRNLTWLLLVYRIPSEPTRLRATVWRRLKSMGAVYLQNSAAAMPASDAAERAMRKLRHEILEMSGTAVLLSCSALAGEHDVIALFQAARDSEYDEILDKCEDFHTGLDKEYAATTSPTASWRKTKSNWSSCATGTHKCRPATCSAHPHAQRPPKHSTNATEHWNSTPHAFTPSRTTADLSPGHATESAADTTSARLRRTVLVDGAGSVEGEPHQACRPGRHAIDRKRRKGARWEVAGQETHGQLGEARGG